MILSVFAFLGCVRPERDIVGGTVWDGEIALQLHTYLPAPISSRVEGDEAIFVRDTAMVVVFSLSNASTRRITFRETSFSLRIETLERGAEPLDYTVEYDNADITLGPGESATIGHTVHLNWPQGRYVFILRSSTIAGLNQRESLHETREVRTIVSNILHQTDWAELRIAPRTINSPNWDIYETVNFSTAFTHLNINNFNHLSVQVRFLVTAANRGNNSEDFAEIGVIPTLGAGAFQRFAPEEYVDNLPAVLTFWDIPVEEFINPDFQISWRAIRDSSMTVQPMWANAGIRVRLLLA